MKIQLIKNDIIPIQGSSQFTVERLLVEGQELVERLKDYLSRFIVGSLDPDLVGAKPDGFINNMIADRFGDFKKRYIVTVNHSEKVVGILIGIPKDNIFHIFSVHVLPDFREKGVASAMLSKCINDIYKDNYNSILIDVHTNNIRAYNLYKKFGFSG